MLQNMEDELFLPHLIFSDEATFHLNGKVKIHNIRIWGLQNPCVTLQHVKDSPNVSILCNIANKG